MNDFQLAQVNIAKMLAPFEDPIMSDFVNNIERINGIAEVSPGFIWSLKDEDKTNGVDVFKEESLLINISVWIDVESLFQFTYHSDHVEVFKRHKEWFSKLKMIYMALWYIPKGHRPTLEEAKHRLDYLNTNGSTPYAFTFKNKFSINDFKNYNHLEL